MAKRRPARPQWAPAESRRRVANALKIAWKCLHAAGTEDHEEWKLNTFLASHALNTAANEVRRVLARNEAPLARKGRVKRGRTG